MEWQTENTWKMRRIHKEIEYLESIYQQVNSIYELDSDNQTILRVEAKHPFSTPPNTVPPNTVPPNTVPPNTVPPNTVPPNTVPPNIAILYNRDYPYEPITVYVDGTKYEDTVIAIHLPRVLHWLNCYSKEYYIDIFYCKDFLKMIWSPVIRIPHIFVEIECINRMKRMVGYSILLDRCGYLPSELIPYLLSFIF